MIGNKLISGFCFWGFFQLPSKATTFGVRVLGLLEVYVASFLTPDPASRLATLHGVFTAV